MTVLQDPSQLIPEETDLRRRIAALAGLLGHSRFPPGERAALRRIDPKKPLPLAFYRIWLRQVDENLPMEAQTQPWAMVFWGIASMGEGAHNPNRPLGMALAESGYSEARLERLLGAPDEIRLELFTSMVRFLAAKRESFDWNDAAQFLLIRDPSKRERLHRRIAVDFYRNQNKE